MPRGKAVTVLGEIIAREIEPEAWKEYDAEKGAVMNMTAFKLGASLIAGERLAKRERKLVRAAEKIFDALERTRRWGGTGGTQQKRAYAALDSATARWHALTESSKP